MSIASVTLAKAGAVLIWAASLRVVADAAGFPSFRDSSLGFQFDSTGRLRHFPGDPRRGAAWYRWVARRAVVLLSKMGCRPCSCGDTRAGTWAVRDYGRGSQPQARRHRLA